MSKSIQVAIRVAIGNSYSTSVNRTLSVEAYDVIEVIVNKGDADRKITMQPGDEDQVQLLLVTATDYDTGLKYTLNTSAGAGAELIDLDSPLLLVGHGALGLLGGAPESIFLTNGSDKPATVTIVVGRNAATPTA